ncbi:aspartate aminotransferase mitochondrial [Perkinsela sp. CCAP 1560/4]|nr:aspartate aminotransferase mitochondrial [Perkinsela sp. CCAP 1560/4]|eukprot:KNH06319.1 aspartate aminotransferase mitochondrial [Perkinsela sp. CCAP 1560/4]
MSDAPHETALTCERCTMQSTTHFFTDPIIEYSPAVIESLENGDSFFYFSCTPGPSHSDAQKWLIDEIINLTSFASESTENNVPCVNIHDIDDASKYTVICTQAIYLLPQLPEANICPTFLASAEYHQSCQPKGTVVHASGCTGTTFRFTKTIVKFIYSLTVQFKVSSLATDTVDALSTCLGQRFTYGILLERTKRDTSKVDSTAKVKSILLYCPVDGGFLVHNITIVLNTFIPSIVAPIIQSFHRGGALEVQETVENTRNYIQKVLRDGKG